MYLNQNLISKTFNILTNINYLYFLLFDLRLDFLNCINQSNENTLAKIFKHDFLKHIRFLTKHLVCLFCLIPLNNAFRILCLHSDIMN